MKYLFFICFITIGTISFSQDSTKTNNYYCVATMISSTIPRGVFIAIEKENGKTARIKDNNGHDKRFKSLTEAINYMYVQGWELVTTYSYETLYNAICVFKRRGA